MDGGDAAGCLRLRLVAERRRRAARERRPFEELLVELLDDDRFLLNANKLWSLMQDELMYLLGAPSFFWTSLAGLVGMAPTSFRSQVIDSTIASISYFHMHVWMPLKLPPWKHVLWEHQG